MRFEIVNKFTSSRDALGEENDLPRIEGMFNMSVVISHVLVLPRLNLNHTRGQEMLSMFILCKSL